MMTISEALDSCKKALEDEDPGAIDAAAARLLEALGYQVPEPFEPYRNEFLRALGDALFSEDDESRVRAVINRFAAQAGFVAVAFDSAAWGERGDDWTPVPEPRPWLVPGWFPAGRIVLLAGEGGGGKSRLALQLSSAIARGDTNWLLGGGPRHAVEGGEVVVFATYEDEAEHVQWWLHRQGAQADVGDRLRYLSPPGPLWAPDPIGSRHTSTAGVLTREGACLRALCEAREARLLVIDPTAGAYALNENDRALVRGFLSHWDLWARATGCSVLLISHPPKSDADYSGSTDWHAASRAVWTLGVAETGTGKQSGQGGRAKRTPAPAPRLRCIKSSYSRRPGEHWLAGYPAWRVVDAEEAAREWKRVCDSRDCGAENPRVLSDRTVAILGGSGTRS